MFKYLFWPFASWSNLLACWTGQIKTHWRVLSGLAACINVLRKRLLQNKRRSPPLHRSKSLCPSHILRTGRGCAESRQLVLQPSHPASLLAFGVVPPSHTTSDAEVGPTPCCSLFDAQVPLLEYRLCSWSWWCLPWVSSPARDSECSWIYLVLCLTQRTPFEDEDGDSFWFLWHHPKPNKSHFKINYPTDSYEL